jgi:hypothetical protein
MTIPIDSPAPWVLAADATRVRIASRPERFRQENFSELYDSTTIFYDCFWLTEGQQAILLGPPLLNLKSAIKKMRIIARPSGSSCSFSVRELDRHSQIRVNTPPATAAIAIESELGNVSLQPAGNQTHIFNGKRVLLTLNKDNRLEWICDWVRFHRDVHGANAVLLYDNGSTTYSTAQLQEKLAALRGLEAVRVMQWPFKYGPQSYFGKHWDSDYCQSGAFEDARWRYLLKAGSVLNCDVDEFVITAGAGEKSIFALTEESSRGYLRFYGKWVVALADRTDQPPLEHPVGGFNRHRSYQYALSVHSAWQKYRFVSRDRCASKWAIVPAGSPEKSQWKTHMVTRILQPPTRLDRISYRHFREINTSWKYQRSVRENFDAAKHSIDSELMRAFSRVDWES